MGPPPLKIFVRLSGNDELQRPKASSFSSSPEIAYIPHMDTEFEWDPDKAESNLQKHGVSFAEAATVFFDLFSITVPDPLHSVAENRFVITGLSYQQRHLVVVHSDRGV